MLHQAMEHVFNRCPAQYIIHTSSAVSKFTHSLFPLCMPATNWHRVPIRTIKRFFYVFGVMLCLRGERKWGWYFESCKRSTLLKFTIFSEERCKHFCHSDVAQKRTLTFQCRFIKILITFGLNEMSQATVSATYFPKFIKALKKDILS